MRPGPELEAEGETENLVAPYDDPRRITAIDGFSSDGWCRLS